MAKTKFSDDEQEALVYWLEDEAVTDTLLEACKDLGLEYPDILRRIHTALGLQVDEE